jgi:carboxyl-terminal processing protease
MLRRWVRSLVLCAVAFAGGAVAARASHADGQQVSPYAPLDQMARALVYVENAYVDPVERQRLLDGAVKGMVAELDPHSAYMNPEDFAAFNEDTEGSFGGIGVEVDFRDEQYTVIAPIKGSPADRAGIRSGDRIVAVDGRLLQGVAIDKIIKWMRGPAGSQVLVTIRRQGKPEPFTLRLTREHIHVDSVDGKRLDRAVLYLRIRQFQSGTHDELIRAVAKARADGDEPLAGAVLDLRNNPGGLVDEAEAAADELLSRGVIFTTRHRGKVLEKVEAHRGGSLSRLPIVVLVNEYSASAAEILAGALKDNGRATIVGAPTFGKGSVQTIYELPGGAGLRLTTMRYYTPAGHPVQVRGIHPDVLIEYEQPPEAFSPYREDSLEGHLGAERQRAAQAPKKVLQGGKAPEYVPIAKLPSDPTKGSDFALSTAYRMLLDSA